MARSHHLSFPVRSSKDLERAIRAANDDDTRSYVISRARSLGRMDMIPSSWLARLVKQHSTATASLDAQFEEYAKQHNVSSAKLKAVYLRGVAEYNQSSADFGNAVVWGMARVQRFLDGSCDEDLCTQDPPAVLTDLGIELTADSGAIIADVLYGDGSVIARIFDPGVVISMEVDEHNLTVNGELDGKLWHYKLDCFSGNHSLDFA